MAYVPAAHLTSFMNTLAPIGGRYKTKTIVPGAPLGPGNRPRACQYHRVKYPDTGKTTVPIQKRVEVGANARKMRVSLRNPKDMRFISYKILAQEAHVIALLPIYNRKPPRSGSKGFFAFSQHIHAAWISRDRRRSLESSNAFLRQIVSGVGCPFGTRCLCHKIAPRTRKRRRGVLQFFSYGRSAKIFVSANIFISANRAKRKEQMGKEVGGSKPLKKALKDDDKVKRAGAAGIPVLPLLVAGLTQLPPHLNSFSPFFQVPLMHTTGGDASDKRQTTNMTSASLASFVATAIVAQRGHSACEFISTRHPKPKRRADLTLKVDGAACFSYGQCPPSPRMGAQRTLLLSCQTQATRQHRHHQPRMPQHQHRGAAASRECSAQQLERALLAMRTEPLLNIVAAVRAVQTPVQFVTPNKLESTGFKPRLGRLLAPPPPGAWEVMALPAWNLPEEDNFNLSLPLPPPIARSIGKRTGDGTARDHEIYVGHVGYEVGCYKSYRYMKEGWRWGFGCYPSYVGLEKSYFFLTEGRPRELSQVWEVRPRPSGTTLYLLTEAVEWCLIGFRPMYYKGIAMLGRNSNRSATHIQTNLNDGNKALGINLKDFLRGRRRSAISVLQFPDCLDAHLFCYLPTCVQAPGSGVTEEASLSRGSNDEGCFGEADVYVLLALCALGERTGAHLFLYGYLEYYRRLPYSWLFMLVCFLHEGRYSYRLVGGGGKGEGYLHLDAQRMHWNGNQVDIIAAVIEHVHSQSWGMGGVRVRGSEEADAWL
ncbi:hypothetical protein BD779DRAFT_1473560 [Infundibulicybe gibba]|nr:hypothetical protein BD779DRAFT_1473560 [Infundibulicybe gibba]